jgi:hypothetical protein
MPGMIASMWRVCLGERLAAGFGPNSGMGCRSRPDLQAEGDSSGRRY